MAIGGVTAPPGASSDAIKMARVVGERAVTQISAQLGIDSPREWSVELTLPGGMDSMREAVRVRLRHRCGAELAVAHTIRSTTLAIPRAVHMVAQAISTDLLAKVRRHACDQAVRVQKPGDVVHYRPATPPKKKKAAPTCAICGGANELFPEWADACDHTPKERRAK